MGTSYPVQITENNILQNVKFVDLGFNLFQFISPLLAEIKFGQTDLRTWL